MKKINMTKSVWVAVSCFFVVILISDIGFASEKYKGSSPPSLDIIKKNVLYYGGKKFSKINVIGLHQEREGAYLVITDTNSNNWGGPYNLIKLESKEWVMKEPGKFFTKFVFIKILNESEINKKLTPPPPRAFSGGYGGPSTGGYGTPATGGYGRP